MIIREMKEQDIEAVSKVCLDAFSEAVADSLSDEGNASFAEIAASSAFLKRMEEDNLIFVADSNGEVSGVIELKERRHIAMLFVKPEKQKLGIGRLLLQTALKYTRVDTITVSSSLPSIQAYKNYGFSIKGEVAESEGITFQPMEIVLTK